MKRKLSIVFMIISIVIGIAIGIAGEFLYGNVFFDLGSRIPVITIYLSAFALILGVILLLKGLKDSVYVMFGKVMALTLATLLVFSGCSALFEFLYELGDGSKKQQNANDFQYLFLIDDSGSMIGNDPGDMRYDAVETIINSLDSDDKFAVYVFANGLYEETKMGTKNPYGYRMSTRSFDVGGGTDMMRSIMKSIGKGSRGVHTKVIILTDGDPSDGYLKDNAISKCLRKNASISSVGFGQPNDILLNDIAAATGGVYVRSDDISGLVNSLDTVMQAQVLSIGKNRDLLGARKDLTALSFWYGLLRVVFLVILGIIWTIYKYLLIGEKKFVKSYAVISGIICGVAGLLCELLSMADYTSGGSVVRILFCAMWACTLLPVNVYQNQNVTGQKLVGETGGPGKSIMNDLSGKREVSGPKTIL